MLPYFSVHGCSDRRFAAGSARPLQLEWLSSACPQGIPPLDPGELIREDNSDQAPGSTRPRRDLAVNTAPMAALAPPSSTA